MNIKIVPPFHGAKSLDLSFYIHQRLIACWKDSIKVFVKVALANMLIDTGMSKASLMPLGAQVRLGSFVNRDIFKSKKSKSKRGPRKSRAAGQQLGRHAYDIKFGTPDQPDLSFEFHIVVFQHYLHDDVANYKYSKNVQSLEKGKKEFILFFSENWKSYIKVKSVIDTLSKTRPTR